MKEFIREEREEETQSMWIKLKESREGKIDVVSRGGAKRAQDVEGNLVTQSHKEPSQMTRKNESEHARPYVASICTQRSEGDPCAPASVFKGKNRENWSILWKK